MSWMNSRNHSFNQLSVFLKAPAKPGVYALYTSTRCIYVGEGENLHDSLYADLNGENPWIMVWEPTHFSFECCEDKAVRRATRKQLVEELHPAVKELSHEPAIAEASDTAASMQSHH